MTTKLPAEIRQAIQENPQGVRLEDEQTHAVYFLVDEETHRRAMLALQEQQDWAAVQRGLKDREEGSELTLSDADAKIRQRVGFPPRT